MPSAFLKNCGVLKVSEWPRKLLNPNSAKGDVKYEQRLHENYSHIENYKDPHQIRPMDLSFGIFLVLWNTLKYLSVHVAKLKDGCLIVVAKIACISYLCCQFFMRMGINVAKPEEEM